MAPDFHCANCDVCTDKGRVVRMVRKFKLATTRSGRGFGTTARAVAPSNRYDTSLTDEAGQSDSEGECLDHSSLQSRSAAIPNFGIKHWLLPISRHPQPRLRLRGLF